MARNVDLNLDTLKREMLDYLESAGLAVFHGSPGGLEGLSMVLWDTEHYPDYQMFLDVAQKCGAGVVIFATREFESEDLDELLAQLDGCDLTREDKREYESRLREMRVFEGVTCSLELAFDYQQRLYVYEVQPDWYEEFLNIDEEVAARAAGMEDGGDDSLGGYFSKN